MIICSLGWKFRSVLLLGFFISVFNISRDVLVGGKDFFRNYIKEVGVFGVI